VVPVARPANPPATLAPGGAAKLPETIAPTWETRSDYRTYYFEIPAPRGLITDRNGEPLAQSRVAYHLALAFPTVHFRLRSESRLSHDLPPHGD